MSCKIYVGNLGEGTRGEDLQKLFAVHGTVKWADVATDPASGASRGFGFVMMGSEQEAQRAVAALNGAGHGGRMLKVGPARPKGAAATRTAGKPGRPTRPGRPNRPGRPGGGPNAPYRSHRRR